MRRPEARRSETGRAPRRVARLGCALALWLLAPACSEAERRAADAGPDADVAADAEADADTPALAFPAAFRLGAATSAHQIEGGQTNTWTSWETLPQFAEHVVEPSGLATDHYHRFEADFDLARDMGLDTLRLSVEWSRVEPVRGQYDAAELAHYGAVVDALAARDLRPSLTLHHFTEPQWFDDLAGLTAPFDEHFCADGPSEGDFCAWANPDAPAVFGLWCGRVAAALGDRVDEWWTINELPGVWLGGYVAGDFPPGLTAPDLASVDARALPVLRNLLAAHVACYDAIHANDTVDADGDGEPARVGLTVGVGAVRPARPGDPDDQAAADQLFWAAGPLVVEAVTRGRLDADFDTDPEEEHPEWAGHLDILGVQYYASTVVLAFPIHPLLMGAPCVDPGDPALTSLLLEAGCPPAPTPDFPFDDAGALYGKQHDPDGLVEVLEAFHAGWPELPLVVTEQGYANDDVRRAGSIVRHLEACHRALARGIPLLGYYHWSLLDNFEWGRGYAVRFGLYAVDFAGDLARTPTLAADVYAEIAHARGISQPLLDAYAAPGPLRTEPPP
ncbi:MAG: glycoside hydrolase family 1 protein [Deltaproteobacteria bacterium]|nr:glycoside hydrolase family 1 protein [Deltaproteobacteria bacterium]